MNEIIKIRDHQGRKAVSARELYEFLGYDKSQWKRWYLKNIVEDDFFHEGLDYEGFDIVSSGNQTMDFALSINMAKELSMLARNEKGKQARQYFIEMEKVAKSKSFDPDSLSRKDIAKMLWEAEEERERLEAQNQLQAKELKEAAPKVDYYDKVIQSDEAIRTTVIAKDLGMAAGRLNKLLHRMGIQYKVKDTWVLYSDYQGKGYTKSVTHHFTGSDGEIKTRILTCWTQKGREFIMEAVNANSSNVYHKKTQQL